MQHEVFEHAQLLNKISEEQKEWAFEHCFEHRGFQSKHKVICMDCGETFSPSLVVRKRATCPHCDTKLKIYNTLRRTDDQEEVLAIAEVHGEFQVIRNFQLFVYSKKGKPRTTHAYEILQHWILPNGKREVIARQHVWNYSCNSWTGYLEIRDKSQGQRYDVYPSFYHPDSEIKREYAFYGINTNLRGLTFLEAINTIPKDSKAETLLKAKQYSLLSYGMSQNWAISRFWPSIRIAMRHKHKVKDASLWIDYLELLRYFKRDLHSPKYLFPKNIKKEHDRLVAKKRELLRREELERKRQRAERDEKFYEETKKHFFGLEFQDKNLIVKVHESVQDFIDAGDKLKHCVFTNDYHRKLDSLVFSAFVDGEMLETVEVSLKTLEVLQSRGMHNKASNYNERIVALVNANMHIIESRHKAAKRKEKKPRQKAIQMQQVA